MHPIPASSPGSGQLLSPARMDFPLNPALVDFCSDRSPATSSRRIHSRRIRKLVYRLIESQQRIVRFADPLFRVLGNEMLHDERNIRLAGTKPNIPHKNFGQDHQAGLAEAETTCAARWWPALDRSPLSIFRSHPPPPPSFDPRNPRPPTRKTQPSPPWRPRPPTPQARLFLSNAPCGL